MQKFTLILMLLVFTTAGFAQNIEDNKVINQVLEEWHTAAADADFDAYFDLMTEDAVFIGTDATENWQRDEFMKYAKPHFDKGKAWSFTAIERNIYEAGKTYYFDELLDTQMGICRGSGVLKMEDGDWKIAHYVLSIAVPNENVPVLTGLKKQWDEKFIQQSKKQQ